jgi:hypothetical protein
MYNNVSQNCISQAEKRNFWSSLLARSIKTAQKETDLFQSRFFAVFEVGQNFLTI